MNRDLIASLGPHLISLSTQIELLFKSPATFKMLLRYFIFVTFCSRMEITWTKWTWMVTSQHKKAWIWFRHTASSFMRKFFDVQRFNTVKWQHQVPHRRYPPRFKRIKDHKNKTGYKFWAWKLHKTLAEKYFVIFWAMEGLVSRRKRIVRCGILSPTQISNHVDSRIAFCSLTMGRSQE